MSAGGLRAPRHGSAKTAGLDVDGRRKKRGHKVTIDRFLKSHKRPIS